MSRCEFLNGCIFFNDLMRDMPAGTKIFKRDYCMSDFIKCARYKIAISTGRCDVPRDLFPNQIAEAEEIIKKHS